MNQIDHKNIELLRYYITRDIKRIETIVSNENSELSGYFIASLVDALIVALFSDYLLKLSILWKIVVVVVLIIAFIGVSVFANWAKARYKRGRRASGRDDEKVEEVLKIVDEFDNIASDGLLLCSYYKDKYSAEKDSKRKTFYLYEMFHYLEKSFTVYRKIHQNYSMYVDTKKDYLISSYRVSNYLEIAQDLLNFIKNETYDDCDVGLKVRINNVDSDMKKWTS